MYQALLFSQRDKHSNSYPPRDMGLSHLIPVPSFLYPLKGFPEYVLRSQVN